MSVDESWREKRDENVPMSLARFTRELLGKKTTVLWFLVKTQLYRASGDPR